MSLVESCPSTEARSKERLTHTPSSRSAVSARERGVGLDEAEHRGEARRDHPGALALGAQAHRARRAARPRGWRASRTRRSSGSPAGRRASPSRRSCCARGEDALEHRSTGRHVADRAGRGERDLGRVDARRRARRRPASWRRRRARAGRWRRWRSRSWRAPRAARRAGSARGSRARAPPAVPVAVKRAALTGARASHTSRPTSGLPLGLIPAATPAARKPAGSPASRPSSRTCAGAGTQRERKNGCAAAAALDGAHCSPARLGQAEHQVEVLHGLRGGALPEVVDRARTRAPCRCARRRRRTCGRSSSRAPRASPAAPRRPRRTARSRRRRRTARAAPPRSTARVGVT